MVASAPQFDSVVYSAMALLGGCVPLCAAWQMLERRWFAMSAVAGLLVLSGAAAALGYLSDLHARPPAIALLVGPAAVLVLVVAFGEPGRVAVGRNSLAVLVGLQSFRLPLELTMHRAATSGMMPVEFSFDGFNFDIVTGASALLLSIAIASGSVSNARRVYQLVWLWNGIGIGCLLVIFGLAVATSSPVQAFGNQPSKINTWILFFPYVWLPVMLVPTAIFGHILVTRKLLAMINPPSPNRKKSS